MTKKRVLNMTSRKKRNTMLTVSNTNSAGGFVPVTNTPAVFNGNATGRVLWCATAQPILPTANVTIPGIRTATSCYMVGLSEHIKLQTTSPNPWYHRRICFTYKQDDFRIVQPGDAPAVPFFVDASTTTGVQRLMYNTTPGGGVGNTISARDGIVFKGVQGIDWNDVILAPTDTTRISVKFDKTWILRSGNQNGNVYERKLYHRMNKTLVYDDDENGTSITSGSYSVGSKAGMGDYYVYDIYSPAANAQASDQLIVFANTTLYWHEK